MCDWFGCLVRKIADKTRFYSRSLSQTAFNMKFDAINRWDFRHSVNIFFTPFIVRQCENVRACFISFFFFFASIPFGVPPVYCAYFKWYVGCNETIWFALANRRGINYTLFIIIKHAFMRAYIQTKPKRKLILEWLAALIVSISTYITQPMERNYKCWCTPNGAAAKPSFYLY